MNEITESLYAEKLEELTVALRTREAIILVLVHEIGKGKSVSISKGKQKQASAAIARVDWQTLKSSGELRITVTPTEKGKKE